MCSKYLSDLYNVFSRRQPLGILLSTYTSIRSLEGYLKTQLYIYIGTEPLQEPLYWCISFLQAFYIVLKDCPLC